MDTPTSRCLGRVSRSVASNGFTTHIVTSRPFGFDGYRLAHHHDCKVPSHRQKLPAFSKSS
jgi:hypothetical protein